MFSEVDWLFGFDLTSVDTKGCSFKFYLEMGKHASRL